MTALLEHEMKKPIGRPKSGRNDGTAKLDRSIIMMAASVARSRGVSVAEYLSEVTREPVGRDYAKMLRSLDPDAVSKKGGAKP